MKQCLWILAPYGQHLVCFLITLFLCCIWHLFVVLWSHVGKNQLPLALAAKNDVPVKKEMPSPVKTCSFDEQIKGYFPFINYFT